MNHLEIPFFYIFAIATIVSSVVVITNRRLTYGVLALSVTMLSLSGLFTLLHAYFVAVIQILIYAGAILVLFLFVIMLLGVDANEEGRNAELRKNKSAARVKIRRNLNILLLLFLLSELLIVISAFQGSKFPLEHFVGTVEAVGGALFTTYLLPFELVSGILLIGIFGVVNLTQRELRE